MLSTDGTPLNDAIPLTPRKGVPQAISVQPPLDARGTWTVDLEEGADGRAILAECFERRVPRATANR